MSNSIFAATAADAIDYSDDDDEESSASEEVSDISVASSDDSDDGSDNDDDDEDDGDAEEAVFLRDAWDIQKPDVPERRDGRYGGPPVPWSLRGAHQDRPEGVVDARRRWPAPQEEQAKASALDAIFFEGLSEGGPRLLRCWRIEGCH